MTGYERYLRELGDMERFENLAEFKRIAAEYGIPTKPITAEAVSLLQQMEWSGNIRELRNVMERLIILSGDEITAPDVTTYVTEPA